MGTKRFPNHLVIRNDADSGGLLVAGEPKDPARIDADDGTRVGIYVLQKTLIFRQHPRLEPK